MGDAIQQDLMLSSSSLKVGGNESWVPHWSAKIPCSWAAKLRSSPHDCPGIDRTSHPLQSIACLWTRATFVPNLSPSHCANGCGRGGTGHLGASSRPPPLCLEWSKCGCRTFFHFAEGVGGQPRARHAGLGEEEGHQHVARPLARLLLLGQ